VNPLDGCYLKLSRSQEHLDRLNQARERVFKENGGFNFTMLGTLDAKRSKYVFSVDEVDDLPVLEWGIIVGDVVHCLRSALDQLVYGAATDPTSQCAFPIFNTVKEWEIRSPGVLWSVPESLRALIYAAQPLHLGDEAHSHGLAMLSQLSNLDKHRTIPTTAFIPVSAEAEITKTVGIKNYKKLRLRSGKPLERGAEIAELVFESDDSGAQPKVEMNSHFLFEVAFGRSAVPSALYMKPIVQAFNESLGSWAFGVIRKASEILEPGVERLENLSIHGLPPPRG
jgi:hypothetical protein